MNPNIYADEAARIAERASALAQNLRQTVGQAVVDSGVEQHAAAVEPFVYLLAVFLLACFVGYYVVWNVTPALHSPLMGVTNAISSVIVVGAMLATGLADSPWAIAFGFIGTLLASVNIFGGFLVTQRMLSMFQAKGGAKGGAKAGAGASGTSKGWSLFRSKDGVAAGGSQ